MDVSGQEPPAVTVELSSSGLQGDSVCTEHSRQDGHSETGVGFSDPVNEAGRGRYGEEGRRAKGRRGARTIACEEPFNGPALNKHVSHTVMQSQDLHFSFLRFRFCPDSKTPAECIQALLFHMSPFSGSNMDQRGLQSKSPSQAG